MKTSIIVAAAENGAIGKAGTLPWHLPNDLKFFKRKTMGHHMIMGRKTFESIGKPLPGRTSIIITSQQNYKVEGAEIVHSPQEAVNLAKERGEEEVFVIGGAKVINEFTDLADNVYLTEVKANIEDADVFLENFDRSKWREVARESFKKDEKHSYNYDFVTLERV